MHGHRFALAATQENHLIRSCDFHLFVRNIIAMRVRASGLGNKGCLGLIRGLPPLLTERSVWSTREWDKVYLDLYDRFWLVAGIDDTEVGE